MRRRVVLVFLGVVALAVWYGGDLLRGRGPGAQREAGRPPLPGGETTLPPGAEAVSLLGRALLPIPPADEVRGRAGMALEEARERLETDPADPEALLETGRQLVRLGRYRDAVEAFGRGAALHPDDPRFPGQRGRVLITLRRLDEAVIDLRRAAVSSAPSSGGHAEPGDTPEAGGVPASTPSFEVWYHLGLAHYLGGEHEQAALALNEALATSPETGSARAATFWLASVFRRLGLEERARRSLAAVDLADRTAESDYRDLLLLYRGELTPEELGAGAAAAAASEPLRAYGLGLWHFTEGRRERGFALWEGILSSGQSWSSLGYLAAEAELARGGNPPAAP